jgi:hypothetical protein
MRAEFGLGNRNKSLPFLPVQALTVLPNILIRAVLYHLFFICNFVWRVLILLSVSDHEPCHRFILGPPTDICRSRIIAIAITIAITIELDAETRGMRSHAPHQGTRFALMHTRTCLHERVCC